MEGDPSHFLNKLGSFNPLSAKRLEKEDLDADKEDGEDDEFMHSKKSGDKCDKLVI